VVCFTHPLDRALGHVQPIFSVLALGATEWLHHVLAREEIKKHRLDAGEHRQEQVARQRAASPKVQRQRQLPESLAVYDHGCSGEADWNSGGADGCPEVAPLGQSNRAGCIPLVVRVTSWWQTGAGSCRLRG